MTRVGEREVAIEQTAFLLRADEFFLGHSRKADAVVVIDDPLELVDGLHELGHLLAALHFLRQDRATAKRGEIALPSHALARRFGEEEVAGMVEEGSFVEVAFGGASATNTANYMYFCDVHIILYMSKNIENKDSRTIIEAVEIQRIKGLKDVRIEIKEKGLTGIMGPNGVGKSSILHVLACFYKTTYHRVKAGNVDYKYPAFFIPIRYGEGGDKAKNEIDYSWKGTSFKICYKEISTGRSLSKSISKESDRWKLNVGREKYDGRLRRWVLFIGVNTAVPDIEKEKTTSRIDFNRVESLTAGKDSLVREKVSYILDRGYKDYEDCLRKNHRHHIGVTAIVSESKVRYSSLSMGAGEQRVFRIIKEVVEAPEYALILIDEIDILLHQDSLLRFIEVLDELAETKNHQIVFTTHNQVLLGEEKVLIQYLYQSKSKTLCYNKITPDIWHELTGESRKELHFYVEDILAEQIVNKVCDTLGIRRYCESIKYGSNQNCFTVLVGCFFIRGEEPTEKKCLFVLDGDRYKTEEERKTQMDKVFAGNEKGKDDLRKKLANQIRQLIIPPEPKDQKPEEYYVDCILGIPTDSIPKDCREFFKAIEEAKNKRAGNHHALVKGPIGNLGYGEEEGYNKFVQLLSLSDSWEDITKEVREWCMERQLEIEKKEFRDSVVKSVVE